MQKVLNAENLELEKQNLKRKMKFLYEENSIAKPNILFQTKHQSKLPTRLFHWFSLQQLAYKSQPILRHFIAENCKGKTYSRSGRVLFSKKCLAQVILNKFQTNSNYFDLNHSETFSTYFVTSNSFLGYLIVSWGYLGVSGSIIDYELWIIKY